MASHKIRVLCESKNTSFSIADSITEEPLFWWRGNDLTIDLALSDNGVFLTSSDIGSITVAIKALNADADDAVAMIEVLGSGDCDAGFTSAQWQAQTGALCSASWTRAEAALDAGSYVIVVSHDDGAGKRNTYLHSQIVVKEDQHDSVSLTAPPTPATEYYTKTEDDARFEPVQTGKRPLLANESQTFTSTEITQLGENWPEAVEVTTRVIANLHLPNYDYEQSTLHCDVLRFEARKFGWRYWMVHTPIYGETQPAPLEYPVVCVSNDGENWQLKEGAANIITTQAPNGFGPDAITYQHAADTCIVETASGGLRVYWLQINDSSPRRHGLMAAETADGLNWTMLGSEADGWLFGVDAHNLTSPSVIREDDDTFTLFVSETDSGGVGFAYYTSPNGVDTWSAKTTCTMPSGYNGWHNAVREHGGTYYVLSASKPDTGRTSGELRAYQSANKTTWAEITDGLTDSSFHNDYTEWNKDLAGGGIYRGCPIINDDGTWDVWFSVLISDGIGNGDDSGDITSNANLYQSARIALARNVNVKVQRDFLFEAATDHETVLAGRLTPVIEKPSQLTEVWAAISARRGWKWEWGTLYPTGLLTGASERIHPADKPQMISGTNKGAGSMQGRLEVSGVINGAPVGLLGVAGQTTVTALSTIGTVKWIGAGSWYLVTTVVDGSGTVNIALVEGDVILGSTSGATAVVHDSAQDGRVIYPKTPTGTDIFQTGEEIKINGVTLTDGGTAVTVSSISDSPVAGGINVIHHYFRGATGGYAEVWNTSAGAFHGLVQFQAYR